VQYCLRSCCFGSEVEQQNPWTIELIKDLMVLLKNNGANPSSPAVKGRHLGNYQRETDILYSKCKLYLPNHVYVLNFYCCTVNISYIIHTLQECANSDAHK